MALNPRLSPWISKSDVLVQLSHNSFLSNDITAATHHIDDSEEVTQATLHQRAFLALATEFRQDMKSALNKLKDSSMTIYSPVLLYLQGRLSYKLSNAAEAQKALNKSLQLDPTNSLTWCAMGNVYFLVSQFDDASICYHKALLYDHNMVEPYQNLCLLRRIGYVSQDPQKELSILKQSPLSIYTISKQNSSTVTLSSVIPMVVEPDDKVELKSAAAIITEMYLDDLSPLKALQEFEVEEGQDVMEEEEEGLEAKEGEVHHHEEEEAFGREDPERADNEEEEETEVGTELM
ncbi:tetratricopeptide repeat protein [Histomonas meleagridis]|uniref:tetratricopeptide repeat protein n=1 Tax=Histomonas meleagridis TaxID=135588 RepID=UPI0035595B12|nr:tetratricopeptide repeat protein [Histomonas meleagridis]KAH0806529.1 tetratricopeptide repeat protein [Histomonas meleagridis]